jgi:hypothetical protein
MWIWGTSNDWVSDSVTAAAGKHFLVSFGWRTDGEIQVKLNYTGGTPDQLMTVGPGAGYFTGNYTSPASTTDVAFEWGLNSGTYGELCAPQILTIGSMVTSLNSPIGAFLGASGDGKTAEISTATDAYVDVDMEAHYDSMLAVSGYVRPSTRLGSHTEGSFGLAALQNRNSGKSLAAELSVDSGTLKLRLKRNGSYVDSTAFTDSGDVLAFCLYGGGTSGSRNIGCRLRAVDGDTTYTAESSSGEILQVWNRLRIGRTEAANSQVNGLAGGYYAHSIEYADLDTHIEELANSDSIDIYRNTAGRLYRVANIGLQPHQFHRGYYAGTISFEQVEAI